MCTILLPTEFALDYYLMHISGHRCSNYVSREIYRQIGLQILQNKSNSLFL